MRKRPSLAARAVLAVALMIGFYLLAIGVCAGLGWLVWVDLQQRYVHPKLVLFVAITIGIVLWSVFPRAAKFSDPGVRLREAETALGDPVFVVRGDERFEPLAIGGALAAGELTETAWAEACAKHGIGDLLLAGPKLPIP